MIDASIVHVAVQCNTHQESIQIKQGEVLQDWHQSKRAQKDVDACWTKKYGKSYYGYKRHVHVDSNNGLIRKYEVSATNEHDSHHFERLLDPINRRKRVSADSAYASQAHESTLKTQGFRQIFVTRGHGSMFLRGYRNKVESACSRLVWRVCGQ